MGSVEVFITKMKLKIIFQQTAHSFLSYFFWKKTTERKSFNNHFRELLILHNNILPRSGETFVFDKQYFFQLLSLVLMYILWELLSALLYFLTGLWMVHYAKKPFVLTLELI